MTFDRADPSNDGSARYREGCGICGWIAAEERPREEAAAEYDAHIAAVHPHLLSKRRPADVVDPEFEFPELPVRRERPEVERARFKAMRSVLEAAATPVSEARSFAEQIATADEWSRWPRLRAVLGGLTHIRELLYADAPSEAEDDRVNALRALLVHDFLFPGGDVTPDFVVQIALRKRSPQRDAQFDEIERQLEEREPLLRGLARSSNFARAHLVFVDGNAPPALAQLELEASANEILEALPPHLRSVAVRIAVGREPKDIAAELGKTAKTIRRYEDDLRARLGAKNRAELVNRIRSAS